MTVTFTRKAYTIAPLQPPYCRRTGRAGLPQILYDRVANIVQKQVVKQYQNATATSEPMINQSSENVRITAGGKQTILDVMVTCPAAPSMVNMHASHLIPGAAAVRGVKKRNHKYFAISASRHRERESCGKLRCARCASACSVNCFCPMRTCCTNLFTILLRYTCLRPHTERLD